MAVSRSRFVARLEVRLDEMNADLEQLETRVRTLATEARPAYVQHLAELDDRRDLLRQRIEAVRVAGDASWKRHRQAAEKALTALVAGMADAKERLESELLDN
jgi:hypothetical protein